MPSLRDHARDTLSAREPDSREARLDLEKILGRARSPRGGPPPPRWLLLGPSLVAAALAIYLLRPRPPSGLPRPASAVHLYLRINDEPESQALVLDLDPQGDH